MRRILVATAALLCLLAMTDGGAHAQRRRSTAAPRTGTSDEDNLPPNVPPAVSTLSPTRGISGPRLEPGAVVCRQEDDLQRRAQVNQRRSDGVPDAGNPMENCHLIAQERGVDVVERHGPGRTQVKVKPSGEVGWTDSYLP